MHVRQFEGRISYDVGSQPPISYPSRSILQDGDPTVYPRLSLKTNHGRLLISARGRRSWQLSTGKFTVTMIDISPPRILGPPQPCGSSHMASVFTPSFHSLRETGGGTTDSRRSGGGMGLLDVPVAVGHGVYKASWVWVLRLRPGCLRSIGRISQSS